MALNNHAESEQKIKPPLFIDNPVQVTREADVDRTVIWITEPLKQAAQALKNSWAWDEEEQMLALGSEEVSIKFKSKARVPLFWKF